MNQREEAIKLAELAGWRVIGFGETDNLERIIQLAKNEAFREAAEYCKNESGKAFSEDAEDWGRGAIWCGVNIEAMIKEES